MVGLTNRLNKFQPTAVVKDIFWTALTTFFTSVCAILIIRLLAAGLGPEKFGAYALCRRLVATIAPLTFLGMNIAIVRYVATAKNRRSKNNYFLSGSLLAIVPGFLVLAVGHLLRDYLAPVIFKDPIYRSFFSVSLVLICGYSFYNVIYAFFRGQGQMNRANVTNLVVVGLGPLTVAWLFAASGQLNLIVMLLAALFSICALPVGYYVIVSLRQASMSTLKQSAKTMLAYGLPRVPAGLTLSGILMIGPFLAPQIGQLKDAGFLSAAQSVLWIVQGGVVAFGLVALPKVARLAAAEQNDFLGEKIKDLIGFILHFGIFLTLHFLLWSDQIVIYLLGRDYEAVIPLMRILLVALIPYLGYVFLRSIIDAIEEKAINARNLIMSFFVTLIADLIFIRVGLGITGLALGTSVGLICLGCLTLHYLWKTYSLSPDAWHLKASLIINLTLIAAGLIMKLWISRYFQNQIIFWASFFEGALFAVYIGILWKFRVPWLMELQKRIFQKQVTL
jgi:O-antigen/teichoic acid export membrane protein